MTRKTNTPPALALCAAIDVASVDGAPEWIELLPAGEIRTIDGRGPYRVASMSALVASLNSGKKLPLDECHSTDRAQPQGQPAPARGWMTSFEDRGGSLWAKVDWTPSGLQLMTEKAYSGISPVVTHLEDGSVIKVLRASLTNTPNLTGLTALHSEDNTMDWKAKLIELLGLDGSADDAAIEAALSAKMDGAKVSLQSEEVLQLPAVIALQSEVAELTTKLNTVTDAQSRCGAETFVDAAIAAGRVGLKPVREEYISLHMKDATQAEKLIGAMPVLKGSTIAGEIAPGGDEGNLKAVDHQVMALFGVDEETYAAGLSGRGEKKEAL